MKDARTGTQRRPYLSDLGSTKYTASKRTTLIDRSLLPDLVNTWPGFISGGT